jgi:tetratricopeptide (TPR) repeat protein
MARPEAVEPPPPPEEIKTVEELYLAGLRLNQFYNAVISPYPYYEEALRRDPGDYRVNTQLGILYLKRLMWAEAEERLIVAVERITRHYTMPKDGEAFYYLGLAQMAQGKLAEAYDNFYKATWSVEWHSPAYFSLARIDCRRGEHQTALAHLERSITTNSENLNALNLRATVLRKLDRLEAAHEQLEDTVRKNPLDLQSRNELILLLKTAGKNAQAEKEMEQLNQVMRGDAEAYLELASLYGSCGLWDESIDVLERIDLGQTQAGSSYPMVYYYLSYYWSQKGAEEKARHYSQRASQMPTDYCFPFRAESVDVLEAAHRLDPSDARALYYLGNLLFDHQPDRAKEVWERSRELDDSFSIVHRNLALAYSRVDGSTQRAIESMEKAVELAPEDPRLFYELDILYENGGVDLNRRRELLEENRTTVSGRVDALTRQVLVYVQSGAWDEAIELLMSHRFNRWEGGEMVRQLYVDAHLLRGSQSLRNGNVESALSDFLAADSYPPNLEQGRPVSSPRFAQVFYCLGLGYEANGDSERAQEYWKAAAAAGGVGEGLYYQGLALSKLEEDRLAAAKFNRFWDFANSRSQRDFFAKFSELGSMQVQVAQVHYLRGLAYRGKGDEEQAREQLALALEKNPNHYWAKNHLGVF